MSKVVIQLIEPAVGIIELAEGFSVPLTFSVADIRDLSKRKGATSKSIKIPGTKNNNMILNNLFDANVITKTFDYNKLQKCVVIEDGIVILDNAFIQLIEINNKPDSANWVGNVEYTALIKDDVSTFFTQIDGKMLSDLKLGEYNHTFDASTIISMMNNTHVDGIKYHFNYNNSNQEYNLSNFTPDVFAKTYFDKIIADAGFVYEWPSMTGDTVRFDEVVIPWNGDAFKFETSTSSKYNTRIQKTGTTTYSPAQSGGTLSGTSSNIDFNNEVYDDNNFFDLATDKYTNTFHISPNSAQLLNIRMDIKYKIKLINNEATTVYLVDNNQDVNFWETFSTFMFNPYVKVKNPSVTFGLNDVEQSFAGEFIRTTQAQGGFGMVATPVYYSLAPGETVLLDSRAIINPSITVCNPTNELGFEIGMKMNNSANAFLRKGTAVTDALANVKYEFIIESIECDIEPQLSAQGYGTDVDMNKYIPKMKQSEFISSFLNLYNLYVDVDKENDKKLIFTLRDDFYDAGKQKDWTRKLAKDLGTDIKLLPELSNKKLLLTYKQDDSDGAMKGYLASTGEVYGQVEYTYDSEYVKGEQKKELLFSPVVTTQDDNANYLPFLAANPKGNIKIALNAKQLTSALPFKITNYPGNVQQTNTYPLIHSWDNGENATFDLNFGLNDYYFYYGTGSFTNNNMYNLHWRRTVNQINKGKMLTAYFNLNSSDIKNLKLNDTIVINNTIWNINQVIDYQPSLNKPTKVELISVDDSVKLAKFKTKIPIKPLPGSPTLDPVRNPITPDTGNGGMGGNVVMGVGSQTYGTGNVIGAGAGGSVVRGKDNTVNSKATINGDDNNVGAGADGTIVTGVKNKVFAQSTVNGDSNTIDPKAGGSNVTGVGNTLNTQATVNGDGNVIEKEATGSVINGTRNEVKVQSTVFGDDNVVTSAATKSAIFGSNITAVESDTFYVDNVKVYDTITLQTLSGGTSINNLGIDSNGNVVVGDPSIIYNTYSGVTSTKNSNQLIPGTLYYITDRDIILTAIKSNSFALEGSRIQKIIKNGFYTPYNQVLFGQTNYYGGIYGQTITKGSYPNSVPGTSAYYVIWGGRVWYRDSSGADVPGTGDSTISGGWTIEALTSDFFYENKTFSIVYDFENDYIYSQTDNRGNVITPNQINNVDYLNKTDWGNVLIKNNKCAFISNNFWDSNPASIFNNEIEGSIYNNTRGIINNNTNIGSINENNSTQGIVKNANLGDIKNNITTNGVNNNINTGNINDNIANGGIVFNSNTGNIEDNLLFNGNIHRNSNNGEIRGNRNSALTSLYIYDNKNNGWITKNLASGNRYIYTNINNGNIGNQVTMVTRGGNVTDTAVNK